MSRADFYKITPREVDKLPEQYRRPNLRYIQVWSREKSNNNYVDKHIYKKSAFSEKETEIVFKLMAAPAPATGGFGLGFYFLKNLSDSDRTHLKLLGVEITQETRKYHTRAILQAIRLGTSILDARSEV